MFKFTLQSLNLFVMIFSFTACTDKQLEFSGTGSNISGSISGFSAFSSKPSQSVSAFSCTTPQAEIYSLDSNGVRSSSALATTAVAANGTFTFKNISSLGIDTQSSKVKYLIAISGCSDPLSRPLTDKKNQEISWGSTIVEKVSLVEYTGKKTLSEAGKTEIISLITKLDQISGSSLDAIFTNILSNPTVSSGFQTIFQFPATELQYSQPTVNTVISPSNVNELATANFSVSASHWHPSYTVAYIWKLDGSQVATTANYNYTPSKTSQGLHTIELFIGKSDGAGGIDLTKAYVTKSFALTVNDTYQPTPPALTLSSASPTNSQNATLSMNTGAAFANCDSFATLALTENSPTAPVLASAYNMTCTSAGSQNITYTLTAGDGIHTLRLWARDSSGNISPTPASVSVVLDTTGPTLTLADLSSVIRGGSSESLAFTKTDSSGFSDVKIQYAADGVSFSDIMTVTSASSPQSWTVPVADTSGSKLKIIATDQAGNSSSTTTSGFNIDSTLPSSPTVARTSPSISNSTTVSISTTCHADYAKILYSSSSATPSITDSNWENCTASKNFSVATGDGVKTIYVFTKDSVGNISSSSNVTATLDQTNPSVSLQQIPSNPSNGGSVPLLSWNASDTNLSSAPINLEYSVDNGSSWVSLATGLLNGANSGCTIPAGSTGCYAWTLPSINSSQVKVKVIAFDQASNTNQTASSALTVDSTAPTISFFQLAGGTASIGMPTTTFALTASDSLSGNYQIRLSENATFVDAGWMAFATSGNFTLSSTNGLKTVYLWVKDTAGNVSAASSASVTLDFGSPPTITITGPSQGSTFSASQTVPISWSCSSTNSLTAAPINLKYTTDDGATFISIQSGLTNNLSSTTGSFDWTLPGGVSVFRLLIECESAAGVRSSAFSGVLNSSVWSIYVGDPWYGLTNVNALLVNLSSSSRIGLAADKNNNVYYVKDHSIMRIDAQTGLVTTWANVTGTSGTGAADGMSVSNTSATLSSPRFFGTNASGEKLYLKNGAKVFSVDFASGTYSERADLTGYDVRQSFVTKNDLLIFSNHVRIYTVDLSIQGSPPVLIHGDGTCGTIASAGTDATLSPTPITDLIPAGCAGEANIIANDDGSKIWLSFFNTPVPGYRLDKSGSTYLIGPNLPANYASYQNCVFGRFDSFAYCTSRWTGRVIYPFDTGTGLLTSTYTVPFTNNDDLGFLGLGSMNDKLISVYSLNTLQTHNTASTGGWSTTVIAGQPLTTMGNGTSGLSSIGFQDPRDLKYNTATNTLYIRNISGHIRKIDYSTSPATVSTLFSDALWIFHPYFHINLAGTALTTPGSCARLSNFKLSINPGSLGARTDMLSGPCNQATGTNPPASGANALDGSVLFLHPYTTGGVLMHSNGKVYISNGTGGTTDVMIYELTGSVINQIAGKTGPAAYNAADSGTAALGASLCHASKILMQEIASGTYAGDLLVLDCDRLRRISITTEPATPKIYDVVAMSLATGWSVGLTPTDFIYDQSTEASGALGTGTVYYASGTSVRKWVPNAALTSATDTAYNFSGTSFSGVIRIALTPDGLLVLQPNKARILRVVP